MLVDYYPRRIVTYREFQNAFKPLGLELENDDEYDRLEHIELLVAQCRHLLRKYQSNVYAVSRPAGRARQKRREKTAKVCSPLCFSSRPGAKLTHRRRQGQEMMHWMMGNETCMQFHLYKYCIDGMERDIHHNRVLITVSVFVRDVLHLRYLQQQLSSREREVLVIPST